LRQIGFRANRRLPQVERLSHDCILGEDTFQKINGPVERTTSAPPVCASLSRASTPYGMP
jgi:hypothetical protein